jgi:hypothetical protein
MYAPVNNDSGLQALLMRWAIRLVSPEFLEAALALFLLLVILFGITGCQTLPEKPIVQTVTIEKPVQVLCKIPPVERPAWETERANTADVVLVSRAIRAELEQRRGYEAKLEGAQQVCQ